MKQYVFFIITLSALSAQSKPFNSFNVIIYPEYYFEGIMAELEAEIKQENLPLGFKMSVPDNSDSIFFVSGDSFSDPDVKNLIITYTATYIPASVIKDNKLAQYSSIVIEFGALSAFCIMS